MTFAARVMENEAAGFAPVVRTYGSGSGTETVPAGASTAVIKCQGPGQLGYFYIDPFGVGNQTIGGGAGGEAIKTVAVVGGNSFSYTVAPAGSNSTAQAGTTAISGTASGGSVNLFGYGGYGGATLAAGGPAAGGDTNTTGGAGDSAGNGGIAPGTPYGNGGNAIGLAPTGGVAIFEYS